jgi:murein DD-endopeptidase MepM/ murein hydrolase activator NlpD
MKARAFALVVAAVACGDSPVAPRPDGCGEMYPPQETSPYVLPYSPGESFVVGQGNCSDGSHHPSSLVRFAYDFLMPVGTPVVASRDGVVLLVEEGFTDGTRVAGQENYINVTHDDGTIAAYVHLTKAGALVEVGDRIAQGQWIGLSGDTRSSTEPHLHFHVQACSGCATLPLTFRNTRPHPRGLVTGESYLAAPW